MNPPLISIIIDVFNLEHEISGLLRVAAAQRCEELYSIELIVVDKCSTDNTVLEALCAMEELGVKGHVVQNGEKNAASALNTGIMKSKGDYIAFLRPSGFCRDYIRPLVLLADKKNPDFISSSFAPSPDRKPAKKLSQVYAREGMGVQLLSECLEKDWKLDLARVLLKRDFIIENHLFFLEQFSCGYEEAFVSSCLLYTDQIVRSPVYYPMDLTYAEPEERQKAQLAYFDQVDAMQQIYQSSCALRPESARLNDAFQYFYLPRRILNLAALLRKSGFDFRVVARYMRKKGYIDMLYLHKGQDQALKRQILLCKHFPILYP